jgi:glucosylglycerate phosphorylase
VVDAGIARRLHDHLRRIYGDAVAGATAPRLLQRLERFRRVHPGVAAPRPELFDQTDVILSAYGDQVREPGAPTLQTLRRFLSEHTGGAVTGLHLLPLHPASSDDGFAVVDYGRVAPDLGDWADVAALAGQYRLMLDAVVNHTSTSHPWFLRSQCGEADYTGYYRYLDPGTDLSSVTRPRTTPLLTPGWTADQRRQWVWTTFGPDQVDLNYANPQVLLAVTDVLLDYLGHGAGMLRLDAVAFLWKRLGTSCMHLPETHEIVRLWRTVLDAVAPGTLLATETNVPHQDNMSYFGDGTDEAHLVYQFALPPLTLAAFHFGDATMLRRWAASLTVPGGRATFLNFLASHDGIGLRPAEQILAAGQIARLCRTVERQGGRVSYRKVPPAAVRPYELNSSYLDALSPDPAGEPAARQVDRFLAAHSIMLSLVGIPVIYFHSLFGSHSWLDGVDHTGQPRAINRQRLARLRLAAELADPASMRSRVLHRLRTRIEARVGQPAFHPAAAQVVFGTGPAHLALQRIPVGGGSTLVCVHDVSGRAGRFRARAPDRLPAGGRLIDLCDGSEHRAEADGTVDVALPPYGVRWLRVD